MVWALAALAGAQIASSVLSSKAASKAAKTQAASDQAAIDEQRRQFDLTRTDLTQANEQARADLAPYRDVGATSLADLVRLTQDPNSIRLDPAYQFRLDQGVKAIDRGAAARGMLTSGSRLQALTDYGQGLASTEYGNSWNRLRDLTGVGQSATGQTVSTNVGTATNLGNLGASNASQIGQLLQSQGANRASAYVGRANAFGSGVNNLTTLAAFARPQWFTGA
jgi:hypothetical protein